MTIINRALHKAYKRRADAGTGPALEARAPSVTGWASKVRDPIRPIQAPDKSTTSSTTPLAQPDSLPAPAISQVLTGKGPVIAPAAAPIPAPRGGTTVRFDSGHLRAKPQAAMEATAAETKSAAAGKDDMGGKVAGN